MKLRPGFTLVEILVAFALLVIGLTISSYILTGLRMNPGTRNALTVSQASTQWMDSATNLWAPTLKFGHLDSDFPAVPQVAGFTWKAQVCEVNVDVKPATASCGAEVTTGLPKYASGTSAPLPTTAVVRLNLTYVPTSGSSIPTSMEYAKK